MFPEPLICGWAFVLGLHTAREVEDQCGPSHLDEGSKQLRSSKPRQSVFVWGADRISVEGGLDIGDFAIYRPHDMSYAGATLRSPQCSRNRLKELQGSY